MSPVDDAKSASPFQIGPGAFHRLSPRQQTNHLEPIRKKPLGQQRKVGMSQTSKTYEKIWKEKAITHLEKKLFPAKACVYGCFRSTCGVQIFPWITLGSQSDESPRLFQLHCGFPSANWFYRDCTDLQRPLSLVQPVCWPGPPLQPRCSGQNW